MTALLTIAAFILVLIGIILALPCKACQRRRERLQAAYDQWRETRANPDH